MKFLLVLFLSISIFSNKEYKKTYHENGAIKAQGWIKNNQKTGYWYFYDTNSKLVAEGHFKNNNKHKWWIFYNNKGEVTHKCQLKNNKKNGYCLKYNDEELISAEKYTDGKKVNEWFSFSSFKKENNLNDLK